MMTVSVQIKNNEYYAVLTGISAESANRSGSTLGILPKKVRIVVRLPGGPMRY